MPPVRRRTKQTADRAVGKTEELLDAAGCAVNELTQNDYGFDLHVQLPDHMPGEDDDEWPMSPHTVLVQVKGGAYVDSGVRLRRDRWEYLLGAMTPVYLAAVPAGGDPWIAGVEELLPNGLTYIRADSYQAEPRQRSWEPGPFVSEALVGAKLGTPRLRRWWRQLQPDLKQENPRSRGHAVLRYLLDLEILAGISGPVMSVDEFQECAERVRALVENQHALVAALDRVGLAQESASGAFELSIDLAVYVPESDFVEQSGTVTNDGITGHNNIVAIGESLAVRHLSIPTIEAFLADFDWDFELDPDEYYWE